MEKVIFLDRDGTLNEEVNYLHRKEDLVLLPGVPEALKAFKEQGYKLVVIRGRCKRTAPLHERAAGKSGSGH